MDGVCGLIDEVGPGVILVEDTWFGLNAQTAIKLAKAVGGLLWEARRRRIEVIEVAPSEGKMALSSSPDTSAADMVNAALWHLQDANLYASNHAELASYVDDHVAHALGVLEHYLGTL